MTSANRNSVGWSRKAVVAVALACLGAAAAGCDPDGKKKCAWVLEPEPRNEAQSDPGMYSMCARNRETVKEDCRLQTTKEQAMKWMNRKFRYVDLVVQDPGLPRTIKSITFCD